MLKVVLDALKYLFVVIQFGGILLVLLSGPVFPSNIILLLIELSGILLGIWAVMSMKPNNTRILPDLKPNSVFVSSGPYRFIRHPMYLGIILFIVPLIIYKYSVFRAITAIIIIIDLVLKSIYEERLLKKRFEKYIEYSIKTYRIIPFIF